MSMKRGMDKEDVVHIYSVVLLSHKKEQNCAICRDMMDLETVIQNEVSQKEENKYHILTHTYMEFRRMVQMNLFPGQE